MFDQPRFDLAAFSLRPPHAVQQHDAERLAPVRSAFLPREPLVAIADSLLRRRVRVLFQSRVWRQMAHYPAIHAVAVFVVLMLSTASEGAVISRDWKTPGDGLLTYDDVNKREWLDLTESRLSMFAGAQIEDRYQKRVG